MTPFETSREIAAPVEAVFAAFSDAQRMARWWGPAGFTNTFHSREFKSGGHWSYVMHGPDGRKYPNESVFDVIEPPSKVVIRHVSEPKYLLTILLSPASGGTLVSWSQAFENPSIAARLERFVVPANEQNLDRLAAEVLSASS